MKKYFIITVFAFVFSFSSLLAVDKKYVPENSVLVISSKINNIANKAGMSTKELMNAIIFNKLATNFSEERKDDRVSYSFQNEIVSLLDFEKNSKGLMLDTMDIAVIADVLDLEKLDMLMIRIALEERVDILSGDGLTFRYLELDDNLAFAWNKDIFTVLAFLDTENNYYASYIAQGIEPLGMFETAKLIFSKKSYRQDKALMDIYNKNNDMSAWFDSYYFYKVGMNLSASMYGLGNISTDTIDSWYKDSSIVVTMDFLNGKVNTVINSYYPNMSIDYTKIKKSLDNRVLKYVNDAGIIGFASLAFNSAEFGKLIDYALKQFEDTDASEQIEYTKSILNSAGIKNYEELLEMFGGDVFAYAFTETTNDYQNINYLVSLTLKDQEKVKSILEVVSTTQFDEADGGYYTSVGTDFNIYIKENMLYIGNNTAIENLLNNKPRVELAKTKVDLIKNKTFALYVDFKYLLKSPSFGNSNVDVLDDLYFTAEYVSKSESKMTVEINFIDKETNALTTIYNTLK